MDKVYGPSCKNILREPVNLHANLFDPANPTDRGIAYALSRGHIANLPGFYDSFTSSFLILTPLSWLSIFRSHIEEATNNTQDS